jgi:hypothetical protein
VAEKQSKLSKWDIDGRFGYFYYKGERIRINSEDITNYRQERTLYLRYIQFDPDDIVKEFTFAEVRGKHKRLTKGIITERRDPE